MKSIAYSVLCSVFAVLSEINQTSDGTLLYTILSVFFLCMVLIREEKQ